MIGWPRSRRLLEVENWSRHLGRRAVSDLLIGHAASLVARRGLDMAGEPGLDEMLSAGGEIHVRPEAFLADLGLPVDSVPALVDEFSSVRAQLQRRYEQEGDALPFPVPFKVEDETAFLLYSLVRILAPGVIVETGVANGHSSVVLLSALAANGRGQLHSFDIDNRCGALVEDRDRWSLTICGAKDPAADLAEGLRSLGHVDLFFHDADHRYLSQMFEYRTSWSYLGAGGVLLSDDVDDSRAFFDFCRERALRPRLLFDSRKVIGAVCRGFETDRASSTGKRI